MLIVHLLKPEALSSPMAPTCAGAYFSGTLVTGANLFGTLVAWPAPARTSSSSATPSPMRPPPSLCSPTHATAAAAATWLMLATPFYACAACAACLL